MSKGKLQLGQKYNRRDFEIKILMENGKLKVLSIFLFYGKKISRLKVGKK